MQMKSSFIFVFIAFTTILITCSLTSDRNTPIVSYELNPKKQVLQFYSKDNKGKIFKNHGSLKKWLNKNDLKLKFAMNGGMYLTDFSPQGLYIENGVKIKALDKTQTAYGNFYMQPNGVFYLQKDGKGVVCKSKDYKDSGIINYATQSGPMLVINDKLHPKFTKGSKNTHIRNGVGILPNGNILFAMSEERINFYDFASFFKSKGCKNALYLDGFVSRTYLPEKNWRQEDGAFGIIIAEIE